MREIPFADIGRFRQLIALLLGLHFEDTKLGFLREVLLRRQEASKLPYELYLSELESPSKEELRALAQELTIGETYFFRNIEQFRVFAQVVIPQRIRLRSPRKTLRFLSAGCASGEEAYSLAIIIKEGFLDPSWDVSIRAVDINPVALQRAARARFTSWALREAPPELQQKWFQREGQEFVLAAIIKGAVSFEERNLSSEDPELWQANTYDAIFCRNVLMYFTPENAKAVIARIDRSLAPGGYLFLGHAETLRGHPQLLELCHTHNTFYYQKRSSEESATSPKEEPKQSAPMSQGSTDWVDEIRKASERIYALTEPSDQAPLARWDIKPVLDLLQQERFADALGLMYQLPKEAGRDPDVLLLRAVLLVHSGQLTTAEEVCQHLLALDGMSAGAHYVLALCREGAGDNKVAVEHYQVASYLDPVFAMPRLRMGLLARRTGDNESASRELQQAIFLLHREDATRLLLFGGGFSRSALLALCEAEHKRCQGSL